MQHNADNWIYFLYFKFTRSLKHGVQNRTFFLGSLNTYELDRVHRRSSEAVTLPETTHRFLEKLAALTFSINSKTDVPFNRLGTFNY